MKTALIIAIALAVVELFIICALSVALDMALRQINDESPVDPVDIVRGDD